MSDIILVLGPIAFGEFEIPEQIRFGGFQRLAVHQLPGGQRIIDALGRDDCEITWSGAFTGEYATSRARLLDVLRVQGGALPLTWDVFFYSVVIASFEAEYRKSWWIPYRITCTVLRDEAEAIVETVTSLAVQTISDLGVASGLAAVGGVDLSAAQSAMGAPNATTPGTASYAATEAALSQSQTQIAQGINGADLQLAEIAAGSTLPAAPSPALAGVAAVTGATATLGQLSSLTAATGYVGRSLANLGAA